MGHHTKAELPRSARPLPKGAERTGPLDEGTRIGITFLLRYRPGSPAIPDHHYWQTVPPHERRFLSTSELADIYGSSQEDLDAVAGFAREQGLTVTEIHAGRCRVVASGTAAQFNAAFGIQLNKYRLARPTHRTHGKNSKNDTQDAHSTMHTFRGFEGAVKLPIHLIEIVTAVIGLDNRSLGGHNGSGDPSGAIPLAVPQIAAAYNFPTTDAVGTTVALFAAAAPNEEMDSSLWAGYSSMDITQYLGDQLPPNATVQLNIKEIDLTVGTTTYYNVGIMTPPKSASIEMTCDISILACIAQGVTINVYFTENTEAGWEAFLNRVISPDPGDSEPSILSSSFFLTDEDDSPAQSNIITAISPLFEKAAALKGITSFVPTGDKGANDGVNDTLCHVQYPASDPYVTCCGGTVVSLNNDGSIDQEWAWSDAGDINSPFGPQDNETAAEADFGATGGGVSGYFTTAPSWQGFTTVTNSAGQAIAGRGIPDVAGMVGYSGFVFDTKISSYPVVGTSNVAPLYAGLMAVITKSYINPIGLLNPTLYANPTAIYNDVTIGNNDSNLFNDSPYFTAGPGWDACTGWGSIDGTKLMNVLNGAQQQQCAAELTAAIIIFIDSITGATVTPSPRMKKRPEEQLQFLYGIRDQLLAHSSKGRRYIDTFYRHSAELAAIFTQHQAILEQVDEVVAHSMKTFDLATMADARINKNIADKIKQIMRAVSPFASPSLQKDIDIHLVEIDAFVASPIMEVLSKQ